MTTTKELFSKGLNYILRDIADETEAYESGIKYYNLVEGKITSGNRIKNKRLLDKIANELSIIKENIKRYKKEFKYFMEYYGYTEEDLERLHIHAATDEEIERDYEKDMREVSGEYDNYTQEQHDELVRKVQEYNLLNGLPVVSF